MGNHAQHIRESYPSRQVTRRGRNYIEFDTGSGKKTFVATVDPLHLRASETEIDTAWVADSGAWQWRIASTDYQAHARSVFNVGNLYEWRKGEHWIIVDPQSINWINQDLSRQQIAIKQAVAGVADDATLHFQNAYGTGRHFEYTAHPKRLIKHITIDNLSDLPTPTVTGTIHFEAEFTIANSSGIELYLDGVRWARSNNVRVRTANMIEFRDAQGVTQWYADAPYATDANGETVSAEYEVRRQGGTYFICVRVPREWLLTAAYPVTIDPTFTDGYDGDVDSAVDTYLREDNVNSNYAAFTTLFMLSNASQRRHTLLRFDLSGLDVGVTITSATLYLYNANTWASTRNYAVHAILSGNADWTETNATWLRCVYNAADDNLSTPWAGDTAEDGGTDAGCSVSGTDYNATAMGTWQSDASSTGTEHAISLNTTQVAAWLGTTNPGIILICTDASVYANEPWAASDHATTGYRPNLVVEYTEGAGGDPEGSLIGGKLIRGGLLTHGVLVRG